MNGLIMRIIVSRINSKRSNFVVSSVSYYAILTLIPTFVISASVIEMIGFDLPKEYKYIFTNLTTSNISNIIIILLMFFMISKAFFSAFSNKFNSKKSLFLSIISTFTTITFLIFFLLSYTFKSPVLSFLGRVVFSAVFLFLTLKFMSKSNLKYSIIFSIIFSFFLNFLLKLFLLAAEFFINYERYYGVLAPIFIAILALHFTIYFTFIAYVCAEEFTKISKIKFVKR